MCPMQSATQTLDLNPNPQSWCKLPMVFMDDDFEPPISSPFMEVDEMEVNAMLILNMFEKACQSKRTVKINNGLKCEVSILHMPPGGSDLPQTKPRRATRAK